jgi:uncharacterized protein YeaO (DUF488 family)
MNIKIKRIYETPSPEDGTRILVDRLWPRGVKKENAHISVWLKEIAPSTELRKWFGHDPARWAEFKTKYIQELKLRKEELSVIRQAGSNGAVTLLYAARDERHNEAVVLQELLERDQGQHRIDATVRNGRT